MSMVGGGWGQNEPSATCDDSGGSTLATVVIHFENEEIYRSPLKGPAMIIGRDRSADIHLDNRALSRNHARLEKKGAAIWVSDLGSQNGTLVNGERISEPQLLHNEDIIEVGRYRISLEGVEEAKPDQAVIKLSGPEGEHRFLMMDEELVIGRSPSSDIAIAHKSISRKHVKISVQGTQYFVEDLGSQNGSMLNDVQLTGASAFGPGDIIQMSEFRIELSFMKNEEDFGSSSEDGENANKTMMIDRSELAKAAYIDGDFQKMASAAGRLALGRGGDFETANNPSTTNNHDVVSQNSEKLEASNPAAPPPPKEPPKKAVPKKVPPSVLEVSHPDIELQNVDLKTGTLVFGEDGSMEKPNLSQSFSDQAYLMFSKDESGAVITAVLGDRRLALVNGQPLLFATLKDGDTIEVGVLSIVYKA